MLLEAVRGTATFAFAWIGVDRVEIQLAHDAPVGNGC